MRVRAYVVFVFFETPKTVTVSLLSKYFITQMQLLRRDRGKGTRTENKISLLFVRLGTVLSDSIKSPIVFFSLRRGQA